MTRLTGTDAMQAALDIIPESGAMPFEEWIDKCVAKGVEREMLREWPKWKARGQVVTSLEKTDSGLVHLISRGEG